MAAETGFTITNSTQDVCTFALRGSLGEYSRVTVEPGATGSLQFGMFGNVNKSVYLLESNWKRKEILPCRKLMSGENYIWSEGKIIYPRSEEYQTMKVSWRSGAHIKNGSNKLETFVLRGALGEYDRISVHPNETGTLVFGMFGNLNKSVYILGDDFSNGRKEILPKQHLIKDETYVWDYSDAEKAKLYGRKMFASTEGAVGSHSGRVARQALEAAKDVYHMQGSVQNCNITSMTGGGCIPGNDDIEIIMNYDDGDNTVRMSIADDCLYIAFKGTQTTTQMFQDIAAVGAVFMNQSKWGITVHAGFNSILVDMETNGIFDTIMSNINEYRSSVNSIIVTGHSLGGALAILFTLYLKLMYDPRQLPNIYCRSFASPQVLRAQSDEYMMRIGERSLVHKAKRVMNEMNNMESQIVVNYVCGDDIVPRSPSIFLHPSTRHALSGCSFSWVDNYVNGTNKVWKTTKERCLLGRVPILGDAEGIYRQYMASRMAVASQGVDYMIDGAGGFMGASDTDNSMVGKFKKGNAKVHELIGRAYVGEANNSINTVGRMISDSTISCILSVLRSMKSIKELSYFRSLGCQLYIEMNKEHATGNSYLLSAIQWNEIVSKDTVYNWAKDTHMLAHHKIESYEKYFNLLQVSTIE